MTSTICLPGTKECNSDTCCHFRYLLSWGGFSNKCCFGLYENVGTHKHIFSCWYKGMFRLKFLDVFADKKKENDQLLKF